MTGGEIASVKMTDKWCAVDILPGSTGYNLLFIRLYRTIRVAKVVISIENKDSKALSSRHFDLYAFFCYSSD